MKKRYVVKLTSDERDQLEGMINRGCEAAYRRRHAQVLMLVDEGAYSGKTGHPFRTKLDSCRSEATRVCHY